METNECYVYFSFDGEKFNPDDITEMLGIEPTSVNIKGERIPNRFPKFNSWQLSTENIVNELIDVDELATKVIAQLRSKVELINKIKRVFNASTRLEVVL